MTAEEKKRLGRPPAKGEKMKRIQALVTAEQEAKARRIGGGSFARGVRVTIDDHPND